MALQVGDVVTIAGYPELFPWMKEYVGRTGAVSEVGERAMCVSFEDDDLWIAKRFVSPAEPDAEAEAS